MNVSKTQMFPFFIPLSPSYTTTIAPKTAPTTPTRPLTRPPIPGTTRPAAAFPPPVVCSLPEPDCVPVPVPVPVVAGEVAVPVAVVPVAVAVAVPVVAGAADTRREEQRKITSVRYYVTEDIM